MSSHRVEKLPSAVKKLEKKIKGMMNSEGITLDKSISADMQDLMEGYSFSDKDNSFKACFWKEQMKAISMKNPVAPTAYQVVLVLAL